MEVVAAPCGAEQQWCGELRIVLEMAGDVVRVERFTVRCVGKLVRLWREVVVMVL